MTGTRSKTKKFVRFQRLPGRTLSDHPNSDQMPQGLNSSLVDSMLRRVRQEVNGVQADIESLQGELIRLREQERLLNELSATVLD